MNPFSKSTSVHCLIVVMLLALLPLPRALAHEETDETILVDGQPRRFLVHDFSGGAPAPLVIVLHGGGGSGQNAATQTGFDTVAEREKLIAVYPYGSSRFGDILLTWNAGHCCSYAMEQNIDDVQFISLLIDNLVARRSVDPGRVYVTGLSNGGMMSHRIGFELGDKVAAIAPVISSIFGDEPLRSELAVPTLIINGADDQIVRSDGGQLGGIAGQLGGADAPTRPIAEQGSYWASVNGCAGFITTATAAYQRFTYACADNKTVERYLVTGNGHAWPGGTAPRADADPPVQTFNANEVIWSFFKRFRRDPVPATSLQPYYYDGLLNLPLVDTPTTRYRAQLQLTRTLPTMEFDLKRAQAVPVQSTAIQQLPTYANGVLKIPELRAGAKRYAANLGVSRMVPLQFHLVTLAPVP